MQLQLSTLLEAVRCSDRLARQIEGEVLRFVKPTRQFSDIQQLPGIGLAAKLSKAVWHVMNGEEFKMEMMF